MIDGKATAQYMAKQLAMSASGGVVPAAAKKSEPGSMEWETPTWLLEEARELMGSIDLDPASTAKANERVKAPVYYDKQMDGLDQIWRGNLWLNPPYSRGLINLFVGKFCMEWDDDHLSQACVLTNNATDTKWFHLLIERNPMLLIFKGRISYVDDRTGLEVKGNRQGQVLWYYGHNRNYFRRRFQIYGAVVDF